MYQHAGVVVAVVGIAADMRSFVDEQKHAAPFACQALGPHAAGKNGTDDEVVKAAAGGAGISQRSCDIKTVALIHGRYSVL
jgi:hypothetical protein